MYKNKSVLLDNGVTISGAESVVDALVDRIQPTPKYYSHSKSAWIPIREMPHDHLANAFWLCFVEYLNHNTPPTMTAEDKIKIAKSLPNTFADTNDKILNNLILEILRR